MPDLAARHSRRRGATAPPKGGEMSEMDNDRERCPECQHKAIAHDEQGCAVGVKVDGRTVGCPCTQRR